MRVKMTTITWAVLSVFPLIPGISQAEPSRTSALANDPRKPATSAEKKSQGSADNRPDLRLQQQEAEAQLSAAVKAMSEKSKETHDTQQSALKGLKQ